MLRISTIKEANYSLLAACLVGISALYIIAICVYRIYFHPLSKYPGPKIAACTKLWWLYYRLSGRYAFVTHELHLKYGEIVRISPTSLSFTNAAAWKEIYGFRNGMPENPKSPSENSDTDPRHPSIIHAHRQAHSNLRKLLSNAFSDKVMKGQEQVLMYYINLLVERLQEKSKSGEVIDIVKWYNYVTFDIIGHLAFDEPFDCLKESVYHPWVSSIFSSFRFVHYLRSLQEVFNARALVYRMMPQRILETRKWLIGLVTEKVKRRMTRNPDYVDFMTHLIQAKEKGQLALPDLVTNANVIVIAGSETTATILSGTTYHLLMHPDVMKKLTEEIRTSFESSDDINIENVSKLSYIHGVLNESLRLYPPAAGSQTRVTPPEGTRIFDEWLPGNVSLGMAHYAVFRSPSNFKNPDLYVPERWLDDNPEYADDKKDALQPFSFGPRNCIGRNLAYIEMRLVLAKLIWHFDFELTEEGKNWVEKQYVYTVWEKIPLMIKLHPARP